MSRLKVVVMFGGGGALGAFTCGVWKALAGLLQASGAELAGVGGTSIGAINAAFVARHGHDFIDSARALDRLWRERIAAPPMCPAFCTGPDREWRSWSGLLSGVFVGNPGLYRTNYMNWHPLAGLDRLVRPLMDRSGMWRLLEEELGALPVAGPHEPLLGLAAVEVMSGKLRLFANDDDILGPAHLAASSAIPLLFDPVAIDGGLYWDGDMTRQSALPLLLARLSATGRLPDGEADEAPTMLITVDHMSADLVRVPRSGVEVAYRAMDLLLRGKLDEGERGAHRFTYTLDIRRAALAHDAISGQLDYSQERVSELIAQGQTQAIACWNGAGLANAEAA